MNNDRIADRIVVKSKAPEEQHSAQASYDRLKSRMKIAAKVKRPKFWGVHRIALAAASIMLLLVSGISIALLVSRQPQEFQVASGIKGKVETVVLSDGTTVHLNVGSKLIYPKRFTEKSREVFLVGEAFFDVAKDKKHPFIVRASNLSIRVLGTKFNVRAYAFENTIRTSLVEGAIQIENEQQTPIQQLSPNQVFTFNLESGAYTLDDVTQATDDAAWMASKLVMRNMTLNEVCNHLEQIYNVKIVVASPSLAKKTITGEFNYDEGIAKILNLIQITIPFKYHESNGCIIVYDMDRTS